MKYLFYKFEIPKKRSKGDINVFEVDIELQFHRNRILIIALSVVNFMPCTLAYKQRIYRNRFLKEQFMIKSVLYKIVQGLKNKIRLEYKKIVFYKRNKIELNKSNKYPVKQHIIIKGI